MQWWAVAIGGALGAVCRYGVSCLLPSTGDQFPYATLWVNVVGSLVMGILYVTLMERGLLPVAVRNLLMVGFLGALTTFSTFSLDALVLWQNDQPMMALAYVVATLVLCLLAVTGAIWLTRLF